MRRPLFFLLTGLVLGEAFVHVFRLTGVFILSVFLFATFLCILFKNKKGKNYHRAVFILLFLSFSFFGGICYYGDFTELSPAPGRIVLKAKVLSVQIKDEASVKVIIGDMGRVDKEAKAYKDPKTAKISGRAQLILKIQRPEDILPDDRLYIRGRVLTIKDPTNPGEFNNRIYYYAQGIRFMIEGDSFQRISRPSFSVRNAAWQLKKRVSEVYRRSLSEEKAALLEAMALGDRTGLSEDQKKAFSENGLAHLLVVSGLHISILGGSLFRFLKKRGAGYFLSCAAGSTILLFYGCMTGFGSSAARAVIMYLVYLLAQLLGADYDIISAMSLSGILLLAEYPARLLEGGFQISYLSVFAIGFVLPLTQSYKEKRTNTLKKRSGMESVSRSEKRTVKKPVRISERLLEAVFSGLIISGVTAPLLMRLFFEWTPLSILLNLFLLPCMVPLMLSAVCGGLAGLVQSAAGKLFLFPAGSLLGLMQTILKYSLSLPGKRMITGCPGYLQLTGIWLLEILVFFVLLYRRLLHALAVFLILVTVGICECKGSVSLLCAMKDNGLQVDMLDVGQGECILIRTPSRKTILIDGGSSSRDKVGRYVIIPALKYYGVKQVNYMLVTHMDEDHNSGLKELFMDQYPVENLLVTDAGKEDPSWQSFCHTAAGAGCEVTRVSRGDTLLLGEVTLTCLHPQAGYQPEERNDNSMVMNLSYRSFDMLFTGDLGEEGERKLVSYVRQKAKGKNKAGKGSGTSIDVLKVAHHGSRYSTGESFLSLYPGIQAALISAGRNNRYGHPHKDLLNRLLSRKITVYKTPQSGAIHLSTNGNHYVINGYIKE